jgi:hypothetical protein
MPTPTLHEGTHPFTPTNKREDNTKRTKERVYFIQSESHSNAQFTDELSPTHHNRDFGTDFVTLYTSQLNMMRYGIPKIA